MLSIAFALSYFLRSPVSTGIFLFTNNSVVSCERGKLNGISLSIGSASRAVAPLVVGSMFAATAHSGWSYPLDYSFSFIALSVYGLLGYCILLQLPESINNSKEEGFELTIHK